MFEKDIQKPLLNFFYRINYILENKNQEAFDFEINKEN